MLQLNSSEINGYECPDDPGEPSTGVRRLSVSNREARILAELVYMRYVLEIGTGLGVATRAMAKTAQQVTTLDIDPWVAQNVVPTLPEGVIFLQLTAQEFAYWRGAMGANQFDAAFIDGSHRYEAVKADIEACRKLVKPGGLLIFHDMNIPEVIRAVSEAELEGFYIQARAMIGVGWNGVENGNESS